MKEYSLLRYGTISSEPHLVAIEDDGVFSGYAKVSKDLQTQTIIEDSASEQYPMLSNNDRDNSMSTDAEGVFAFGEQPKVATTHIANPFRLLSLEDVIAVADYERTLVAMGNNQQMEMYRQSYE